MKQNLVVLTQRHVVIIFDLSGDRNDAACNRGDLSRVGQRDPPLGLPLGFILADEYAGPDRLDLFKHFLANFGHVITLLTAGVCGKRNQPVPHLDSGRNRPYITKFAICRKGK